MPYVSGAPKLGMPVRSLTADSVTGAEQTKTNAPRVMATHVEAVRTAVDLARKLGEFQDYYNARRVHRSLDGTPPAQRSDGSAASPAALDHYVWQQHCRGLFQTQLAA